MPRSAPVALAAATAFSAMAWAVRGRSSSLFGPSVWRGPVGRKTIALTFDDGPSTATPALLELLGQYHVPATFFQIGINALSLPDISRAVLAAGHEIGNHSHTHPNFALQRPSYIGPEFERAQHAIATITGQAPALLRAPFGVRWFGFRDMQQRLGLQGVMWSIIGRDWKLPARAIARRVLSRASDGDIICLHDGRGALAGNPRGNLKDSVFQSGIEKSTVEAVRKILPELLEKGYHFETVTQLLCQMK